MRKSRLPIDAILPEIIDSLKSDANLVIEAPPGAGKTTRVPPALLDIVKGELVVLEPRRIAARLAARRVAWEMGEELGETVGYQVRFEEVVGPRTRLRFLTEGVLTRRLLSDPHLKGVDAVVLDEFHERHLETDLALALLKRLQRKRPDLRIVVMSATLEAAPVAQLLGGCPTIRSKGTLFEPAIRHLPYSPAPLHEQVRAAVELLIAGNDSGHILTFMPGVAEIRRAMRECEPVARRAGLVVVPLHGNLPPEEQDRAVSPSLGRKLILATNVAESSVTVEGVTAVIDSGLARIATYSPWSGLPTLQVGRVSKASAKQRAGRAGRTGPGRVLRLYTEDDYLRRPEQDAPELVRSDLSQLCLDLRAIGIGPWKISTGWRRRQRPRSKPPNRYLSGWVRLAPWRNGWHAIRCIHGSRAFWWKRWSAGLAKTAVLPRQYWDRVRSMGQMSCWRLWTRLRITARGSTLSSFVELRDLRAKSGMMTMLC